MQVDRYGTLKLSNYKTNKNIISEYVGMATKKYGSDEDMLQYIKELRISKKALEIKRKRLYIKTEDIGLRKSSKPEKKLKEDIKRVKSALSARRRAKLKRGI